eukprot:TRINITY_DN798_c0_g1_i1.p1 TRINITY_DN798_c0_g1~~TRINITY_DN798_c0_g1_i1.p1  ORF type:complete len:154 (+),score=45.40 TRINITY_DN798_c0_g1_i1:73-534(+)
MSDLWSGRSDLQEFVDRVFITNFFGAKNKKKIQSNCITHVVVCAGELPTPFDFIEYKKLDVADNTNVDIKQYFNEVIEWIDDKLENDENANVLIHCAAGSSRSGSFAIAYTMKTKNISFEEAYEHVKNIRPIVLPNPGFMEQLTEFEKELLEK